MECLDRSLTVDQATDLAKYFLGPTWFAWTANAACIVMQSNGPGHYANTSWREVFRAAGVKLPLRAKFIRSGQVVMNGDELICTACSGNYAQRIANALNAYTAGPKGY